ncbi:hypothetical protein I4U23_001107 [Adineta vaga]|nr:hypothetical protein I4U23_001107 [Adineta vaga]
MKRLLPFIFLIFSSILFDISQSVENCFYFGGHLGTKCFDPKDNKYSCCSADYHCKDGQCVPFRATAQPDSIPLSDAVIIGVSISLFCIVCLAVFAVYWRRRQIKTANQRANLSASFSQSTQKSSRTGSSAGFRVRSATSQPGLSEASVSIERSKPVIP